MAVRTLFLHSIKVFPLFSFRQGALIEDGGARWNDGVQLRDGRIDRESECGIDGFPSEWGEGINY